LFSSPRLQQVSKAHIRWAFLALMQVTCLPDCRACGSPRDFSQHLTAGYFLFWNPPSCQNISFFIYNILLFIVRLETAAQERDTDPDLLKSDVEFTFYAFHFSKKSCWSIFLLYEFIEGVLFVLFIFVYILFVVHLAVDRRASVK
jgi:hypothetical protein